MSLRIGDMKIKVWLNRVNIPGHVWLYGWYYQIVERLANGYILTSNRGPYETRRQATIACMKDKNWREESRDGLL
jgi:hypothetical protein